MRLLSNPSLISKIKQPVMRDRWPGSSTSCHSVPRLLPSPHLTTCLQYWALFATHPTTRRGRPPKLHVPTNETVHATLLKEDREPCAPPLLAMPQTQVAFVLECSRPGPRASSCPSRDELGRSPGHGKAPTRILSGPADL
jgi:hypothetical protein